MKVRSMTIERLRNNPKCIVQPSIVTHYIWSVDENGERLSHIHRHGLGRIFNNPVNGNIGDVNEYYWDTISLYACHTTEVEEIIDG